MSADLTSTTPAEAGRRVRHARPIWSPRAVGARRALRSRTGPKHLDVPTHLLDPVPLALRLYPPRFNGLDLRAGTDRRQSARTTPERRVPAGHLNPPIRTALMQVLGSLGGLAAVVLVGLGRDRGTDAMVITRKGRRVVVGLTPGLDWTPVPGTDLVGRQRYDTAAGRWLFETRTHPVAHRFLTGPDGKVHCTCSPKLVVGGPFATAGQRAQWTSEHRRGLSAAELLPGHVVEHADDVQALLNAAEADEMADAGGAW